jgi:hypothetical protein
MIGFNVVRDFNGRADNELTPSGLALPLPESPSRFLSFLDMLKESEKTGPSGGACNCHEKVLHWKVDDN